MTDPVPPKRIFPTSKVDAQAATHVPSAPQTESSAYKLAFQDTEFLLREDLRPVRFQLELLKPELLLDEAKIASMFVFYGSARIPSPEMADALVAAATNDQQRRVAERLKAKSHYYDVARELARLASSAEPREDGWRDFVVCSCGKTMLRPTVCWPASIAPRLAASMIDGPPPEQTTKSRQPSASAGMRLASRARL